MFSSGPLGGPDGRHGHERWYSAARQRAAAPDPAPAHPGYPAGQWRQPPPRRRSTLVLEVLGVVAGALGLLWMLGQVLAVGGVGMTALAAALAMVPLVGVLAVITWIDRWEPEPRWVLMTALLWGAGVATAVSVVLNDTVAMAVYTGTGDAEAANAVAAVLGAPVVEESAKGLGVLLIFLLRRRYFDGVVDGIVYAATVAAGFAFVENVLYFVQYGDALAQTFVVRAIQSPFAHLIFTACMGIALGLAARSRNRTAWVGLFPLGWVVGVGLHALWNGSALLGVHLSVYVAFQVPLFLGVVLLVLWLRRREQRMIAARLGEYAMAGWFLPAEVAMLISLKERRSARDWAAQRGAGRAMREFQRAATHLAFHRERVIRGRQHLVHQEDEQALLTTVARSRHTFTAPARPAR